MNLSKHKQAILALILANIIWGAASPIFKWSLTNIEPFTLAFLRFFLAAIILFPFALDNLRIKRQDWPKLFWLSFAGITVNISFFFLGLKLTPSINAPIIATSGPLFLLVGCLFILREKLKLKTVLGTTVGFLGILLIILRPVFESGFNLTVLGNLLLIAATLGAVAHAIIAKKVISRYQPHVITFWSFLIGSFTFLPLFLFEVKRVGFLTGLSTPGIVGIIFGVYLSSALAYFCYHWAIKNMLAQEVGVFAYLDPIVAVMIAIPLLGEIPTPIYLLGSLFVFLGIFIAEGRLPYHPLHKWKEG